ncbi:hypothetical protein KAR48_16970 [bacterium]|nr:hypothetical protein [bacterium]
MKQGGALYIEGNDLYRDHRGSDVAPWLPGTFKSDGNGAWLGNIKNLKGYDTSTTAGMYFNFPKWGWTDESPDEIDPLQADVFLESQDRRCRVAGKITDSAKIIASTIVFGAIHTTETSTSLDMLLEIYLTYLTGGD